MTLPIDWIAPTWGAASGVRSFITTRAGGVSGGPYASMNLGYQVNDEASAVDRNRVALRAHVPAAPRWLKQVHGPKAIEASQWHPEIEADACYTREPGVVCAVMIADCMPVMLCDAEGSCVAVAHAGWRGLSSGVLENTLAAMRVTPSCVRAYLGPAIGPSAFEVGDDVYEAFTRNHSHAAAAFRAQAAGKWLCDLFMLARQRLAGSGVTQVFGGTDCTYSDPARFFSHRRDRVSGRMAALIWIEG